MLDLRIEAGGRTMPIFDLPALLGRAGAAREIGDQIDALIAYVDDLIGDPDLEDDDPDSENENRHAEVSFSEWHTRGRHKLDSTGSEPVRGAFGNVVHEDAEDDDAGEDDDPAGGAADDVGEPGAWVERDAQSWAMDCRGNHEDDEPDLVPALMDRVAAGND